MDKFWDLKSISGDLPAIHLSNKETITYETLSRKVQLRIKEIGNQRELILLKAENNIDFLISYLACLNSKNPAIIIDESLEQGQLEYIIQTYKPNKIIHRKKIHTHSSYKHSFDNALSILLSTSGSTGSPKLVKLSKENLNHNATAISQYLGLSNSETAITSMPLSYSYCLSILNSHLLVGASIVLTDESVISRNFWDLIKLFKVSSFSGVPYMYKILKKINIDRFDISSIRYFTQAGGKLDIDTYDYFSKKTQQMQRDFFIMYGQTEATARMSYLEPSMIDIKKGSIGKAIPGGSLKLIDADGNKITDHNITGQITYSGKNVMLGYANNLKELSSTNSQNYILKTGDIGYFDKDGYFYIVGREKRFLKIYGLRYSLDQIDLALSKLDINLISSGVDDKLIIFTDYKNPDIPMIKNLIYKKFKINANTINVKVLEEIPRSVNGKVDYQKLNELQK